MKRMRNAVEIEKDQAKYESIKRFFQASTPGASTPAASEVQLITAERDALQL